MMILFPTEPFTMLEPFHSVDFGNSEVQKIRQSTDSEALMQWYVRSGSSID